MSDQQASIGIFDSGIGGLTVLEAIRRELPHENLIYLGDTARVPYGNRTPQTIIRYAQSCAKILIERNIKALVIACNTVSAHAYEALKQTMDLPIFGVIDPVSAFAAQITQTQRIGIIGTRATISSRAYHHALHTYAPNATVFDTPCPLFVPLVEEGWANHPVSLTIGREYLSCFKYTQIDALILGCTHYPVLHQTISTILRELHLQTHLCDCGSSTARAVHKALQELNLLNSNHTQGSSSFLVTDSPETFIRVAQTFMTTPIQNIEHVDF